MAPAATAAASARGENIARTHIEPVTHEALHHAEAHRTGTDDADAGWHGHRGNGYCGHRYYS